MFVDQINRHLRRVQQQHMRTPKLVHSQEKIEQNVARIRTPIEQNTDKKDIVIGIKVPIEVHRALSRRVAKGEAANLKTAVLDILIRELSDSGEVKL